MTGAVAGALAGWRLLRTLLPHTAAGCVPGAKENEWLPRLASALPAAVPPVLALGAQGRS
ncbi:hypothetical protein [Micromonospora sp. KC213]|uniref:hypothetical protein n=1 Tax=Micromonospora sp. KC213 TaxID=2530378 RepID=UPI00104CF1EA|nr:hypothetical protein [Micromonospora sp. KC213]TDC38831.1 hypothetical protein E1166_17650 [Micromonospora sp. KC213]